MTSELAIIGAALAFGIGSAILPMILNAEVYVIAQAALLDSQLLLLAILALCVGTAIGKAIVFELVRRGSRRVNTAKPRRDPRTRLGRWIRKIGDDMLGWLDRPVVGALTVFASALVSVPPLAVVTVVAALSTQRHWVFQTMVFAGRTLQFLFIAFVFHRIL